MMMVARESFMFGMKWEGIWVTEELMKRRVMDC
jgi:hypothetical protein